MCVPGRCDASIERTPATGVGSGDAGRSDAPGVTPHVTAVTPAHAALAPAFVTPDEGVPVERSPGGIEMATSAFVEMLGFAPGDPRALLGQIAVLLAQRVDDSGALPAVVRELRLLLGQLAEAPSGPAGKLDDLQVRRAQRRLDQILGSLAA